MLFNSLEFAVFMPLVFVLYWYLRRFKLKIQNIFLLAVSYLFYGWWDWRFLLLIMVSTVADFLIARNIQKESKDKIRKSWLILSLSINLGILGFFKYCNFFIESFVNLSSQIGIDANVTTLSVILPVGISFYTFQTLSYTIDVYKRRFKATRNFVAFSAFVSFFPQLVAGPIERASALLPQFEKKRCYDSKSAIDGLSLIIWGLFKKLVIADNCAQYVNDIFLNYNEYNSLTLVLGVVYFSFQIYCDFSGYSDIARGLAKLLGFNLMINFSFPYFSRDIAEFWRRWHISLSTWFRDYVYIPLGGSKGSTFLNVRNVLIVFVLSGFWHGANFTYIVWGAINGLYFLPLFLLKRNRIHVGTVVAESRIFPTFREFAGILITFFITSVGWVFFRSDSVQMALNIIERILSGNFHFERIGIDRYSFELFFLIAGFVLFEWVNREKEIILSTGRLWLLRVSIVVLLILTLGVFSSIEDFIYFQF